MMNEYFKKAGDLDNNIKNKSESNFDISHFKIAEDLNDVSKSVNYQKEDISLEEINYYFSKIVSGKEYDYECELGTLCGAGNCIVSFVELKKMVEEGTYNIISAQCFNPYMIEIRYQEYSKEIKMFK